MEAHGFKQGEYYLSVSTIDKNGLESVPNKSEKITLLALGVNSPDGSSLETKEAAGPGIKKETIDVLPFESKMEAPNGMTCGFDKTKTSKTFVLDRGGPQTLHCFDAKKKHIRLDITVGPSTYSPEVRRLGNADNAKVSQTIPLLFGVTHGDGREFKAIACPEGELKYVNKTPHTIEGVLEIHHFTERCEIQFLKDNTKVASVSVQVDKPKTAWEPRFDIRWDVFVGLETTRIEDDDGGEAGMVGARLSWRPFYSLFRGEFELALLAGGDAYNDGTPAGLLSVNLRLMPQKAPITPFILLGAGVYLDPGDQVLPQGHLGLGAAFSLGKSQLLAEIRGALGDDRSGVLSANFGISVPFGSK